jgi:NADPH:quinone reductase-like Zn-dependent oxidoreductase/SAM-dependent methyltransferase
MLIMAIEAVQQQTARPDRAVIGYKFEQADFLNPIIVPETWEDRTETQVHLQPVKNKRNSDKDEPTSFDFALFSYPRSGQWSESFRARITIEYEDGEDHRQAADEAVCGLHTQAEKSCRLPVDSQVFYRDASEQGLQYGDWFQLLHDIRWDGNKIAVAQIDGSRKRYRSESLVHPALLDTAFHVLRVSAGQQLAANVPLRLANAWFSATSWQNPSAASVRWLATSKRAARSRGGIDKPDYYGEDGTLSALAADGTVLCTIKQAVTTAVSRSTDTDMTKQGKKAKKLLYSIEWKPQLSLLKPQQLAQVCRAGVFTREETTIVDNHANLCAALDLVAVRTLKQLEKDRLEVPQNHLQRHVRWMEHHVANLSSARRQEGGTISDADLEARLLQVEAVLPAWKLYTACARQLGSILRGDVDPLQVVFESDLANIFYADLFQNLCADGRLATLLDLASHEDPAMRILEVGAGTGGMTGHVLNALEAREAQTGAPSFAEYAYTDISPVFFERAKNRWPHLHQQRRMTFKALDLDRSLDSQGFEPGSYDMVIAASVLHATPYLEATLLNVRAALKPGGRLVLVEVINPADVATNFMAGLVPGWWVAREEWRPHSAAVTEPMWDKLLRANGFSGNDVLLRDYKSEACHIMSVIVSTAQEHEAGRVQDLPAPQPSRRVVLVVDEAPPDHQTQLAGLMGSRLGPGWQMPTVCPFSVDKLTSALASLAKDDAVICLVEAHNGPLLASLSERHYECLQQLIKHAPSLLWVTAPGMGGDAQAAHYSVAQGFLRSIRAEQADKRLVNVAVEEESDIAACADFVANAFRAAFEPSSSGRISQEVEYVVGGGLLMTGRAIENVAGNESLRSLLQPQLQQAVWADVPAVQLSVGTRSDALGSESLSFVQDAIHDLEADIGPEEVEIEAKAWSLSQDNVHIPSGQEVDDTPEAGGPFLGLSSGCAGVVTRVGRNCDHSLRPGDRVCMMLPQDAMRKYPRTYQTAVTKLPPSDKLTFEAGAASLVPGVTAYHALADVAGLQHGMSVLIHHATGSLPQIAVHIARVLGASRIFATRSSTDEEFLTNTLGIPAEDVFSSHPAAFAHGVRRATQGAGVDVIFNTLAGDDALLASCECLARGGRFVEVGRANIAAGTALPMSVFTKNITFSAVHSRDLRREVAGALATRIMQLLSEDSIQPPKPLRLFDVSHVKEAFKYIQNGEPGGDCVVIRSRDQEMVSVSLCSTLVAGKVAHVRAVSRLLTGFCSFPIVSCQGRATLGVR